MNAAAANKFAHVPLTVFGLLLPYLLMIRNTITALGDRVG